MNSCSMVWKEGELATAVRHIHFNAGVLKTVKYITKIKIKTTRGFVKSSAQTYKLC